MRKIYLLVAVGAALALVLWRPWQRSEHPPRAAGSASGSSMSVDRTASGPSTPGASVRPGDTKHVRRLTSDERRRLGEQIAAARERARRATSKPGTAPAADDNLSLEQVAKPLQEALSESIGILAECYKQQPGGEPIRNATARMTMTSDPDLGTVIDTDAIKDADGQPLAPKLDECLRDTIDSLALPPLGPGGKLPLEYTFRFD